MVVVIEWLVGLVDFKDILKNIIILGVLLNFILFFEFIIE